MNSYSLAQFAMIIGRLWYLFLTRNDVTVYKKYSLSFAVRVLAALSYNTAHLTPWNILQNSPGFSLLYYVIISPF